MISLLLVSSFPRHTLPHCLLVCAAPFPPPSCARVPVADAQLGGSAKAAAELVEQLKGDIMGFLFILEIPGLNGKEKLGDIPTVIMLEDA